MIENVTQINIDSLLDRYRLARQGETNNDTTSEAMFVLSTQFNLGAMLLTTGFGILWIGIQNATARMSSDGKGTPYPSIKHALLHAMDLKPRDVYYTDNAVERFRWLADRLEKFYADPSFLIKLVPK